VSAVISTPRAIFTDLDGTLLDESQRLSLGNRNTLNELGEKGVCRVVITGRTLVSARRVLGADFPIDILVTSSGAGIFSFPDKELLHSVIMKESDVRRAARLLEKLGVDFMIHAPLPNNHQFRWYRRLEKNPDFDRRLNLNKGHHSILPNDLSTIGQATQLIVICPEDKNSYIHELLRTKLTNLTIIRATSPLDKQSIWYEIFPQGTSKASAAAWVCERYGLDQKRSLAIGNDYNDIDLLLWSNFSRVVANAPIPLRRQFPVVSNNESDGFSEAVSEWWQFVTKQ